ncbi:MAG: metallophosphoesterase family protein [Anaeroplasmataceae bacterium]|nr:metallophosphoesterase family protein [Anaeroplasmataceae bacterium]
MNVKEIVDHLFQNIAYTNQFIEIRSRIVSSLENEYEKKLDEYRDELLAYSYLLQEFSTIQSVGLLAGYSLEEIETWTQKDGISDMRTFKKHHILSRILILLFSFFSTIAISYFVLLFWVLEPVYLIPIVICLIFPICFIIWFKKWLIRDQKYSYEVCEFIISQSSSYFKKTINSFILGIFALAMGICIIFLSNVKGDEVLSQFLTSLSLVEILIFCIIKNICYNFYYHFLMGNSRVKDFKRHLLYILGFASLYWLIIGFVIGWVRGDVGSLLLIIFGVLYFGLALFYILKFRKRIPNVNLRFNKLRVSFVGTISLLTICYVSMRGDSWLLQPYINQVSAIEVTPKKIKYDEESAIYTITTQEEEFKLLQLTDIHLGGSNFSIQKDTKALQAVYKLIEYTKPDLVIVTGDLVFPLGIMSFSFNNNAPIMQFASFMRNTGIPWAFTYGNHDTESLAVLSEKEVDKLFQQLSFKNSRNLLYPYKQPDIYGRNNQIIEIRGKNDQLIQALFLLDSNSYIDKGINQYDYIHDDQVDWYKKGIQDLSDKEGRLISSMAFFHMPLNEYKEAYTLYKQNSKEVIYHFGKIGEKNEEICDSKYHSKLFEIAVELGSTKAMFCGHDHLNNIALSYKGIFLSYGLSIDYLAYPGIESKTEQRGATLITLFEDETYKVEPIHLNSIV